RKNVRHRKGASVTRSRSSVTRDKKSVTRSLPRAPVSLSGRLAEREAEVRSNRGADCLAVDLRQERHRRWLPREKLKRRASIAPAALADRRDRCIDVAEAHTTNLGGRAFSQTASSAGRDV